MADFMNGGPRHFNGGPHTWPGIDPISLTLGELRAGQKAILVRMDRQDEDLLHIRSRLEDHELHIRSSKPPPPPPPWWSGLPLGQLAALAVVALMALAGILQPGETRDVLKTIIAGK